jgi:DNA polymerase III subunit delta'
MKPEPGNRRLVGQSNARRQISRILESGRTSHAYLFTGPEGVGKLAFALAFAEYLNGIDNLTDLGGMARSKKSSWFRHPDIHLFIPLPTTVTNSSSSISDEMKSRLAILEKDPYEIVDFKLRPVLDSDSSSMNKQAFYPIRFFHEHIRPVCNLKPNEGRYSIVIIKDIETMRNEAANAFLKLLEEPPENVIFLLTASKTEQLLPTIISRCQLIRLSPLSEPEISGALVKYDGYKKEDAAYLARISGGNYSLARFYDLKSVRQSRTEIIGFLRMAYVQDAGALITQIQNWQSKLNTENQIALCNTLEMVLRDLMIYRETLDENLITNIDQIQVIKKFCESLKAARIDEMIDELHKIKPLLYQNVQFKLAFTSLAFRFGFLMRGHDPVIPEKENWKHLPALT